MTRNADASRSTNSVESPAKGMSAPALSAVHRGAAGRVDDDFRVRECGVEQNDLSFARIVDEDTAVRERAQVLHLVEGGRARRDDGAERADRHGRRGALGGEW